MNKIRCDACKSGTLRTVQTVPMEDGARYRKKFCKSCGKFFYTREEPATKYDFNAAVYMRNTKRKEVSRDD